MQSANVFSVTNSLLFRRRVASTINTFAIVGLLLLVAAPLQIQRAKKVVSGSPGLVEFAIGQVNSVFKLPDGQVMFFEEFE